MLSSYKHMFLSYSSHLTAISSAAVQQSKHTHAMWQAALHHSHWNAQSTKLIKKRKMNIRGNTIIECGSSPSKNQSITARDAELGHLYLQAYV